MMPLNTRLGLPSRAFWYIALRVLVVAFFVLLIGSLMQLLTSLPGASCNGHSCNPASGAHLAAFVYLFAACLIVLAVLNFKWYSFVVTDRNITVESGVLTRTSNTIRFDRIQDVNVRRDPLHMLLGLKSLDIWTASPDQFAGNRRRPEGHLVLDADDADWLRDYLTDPAATAAAAAEGDRGQSAHVASSHGGNGAVIAASLVAAALVVLAVTAAMKKTPPGWVAEATANPAAPPARYVAPAPAAVQLPAGTYSIACTVRAERATGAVRACDELPSAQRCRHEGDFGSQPTAEPAVLTLVNKSDESVKFFWLNGSGVRALYATLPPGARVDQPSHPGAHWLVATAAGDCLGVFDAATTRIGIF